MSKRDRERLNPFEGGNSLEDVADEIYGKSDPVLDVGRVVAMQTSIDEIWADVKQPRRAVPASIRLHWNGNPEGVAELLNQWYVVAKKIAPINLYDVLQGRGEGIDIEDAPAIFTEYLALLRLAASIAKDGLINPISIIQQDGRNLIETGERRWLAYHLLNMNMGTTDWARIPVTRSNAKDSVWRQATENTQRRQLNAIGMARQIALLVMESRRGLDGQEYNDFDELVLPGGCDRKFYAQVANGNIHRIPRGMGERITAAMGELSMEQLRHYRQLLKLTEDDVVNDALWLRGDVEGWAERFLRDTVTTVTVSTLREIVSRENWGREDLEKAMEMARGNAPAMPTPVPTPPPQLQQPAHVYVPQLDDRVRTPAGHIGSVVRIEGALIWVQTVNSLKQYYAENLTLMGRTGTLDDRPKQNSQSPATPIGSPPLPSPVQPRQLDPDEWSFEIGEAVAINATGDVLEVVWMKTNRYGQEEASVRNEKGHTYDITADQLTSLVMTYEEYLRRHQPETEAAPEINTDKNDSLIARQDHVVLERGSKEHQFFIKIGEIADLYGHKETADTAREICAFTLADVDRMDGMGEQARGMYYDVIIQSMSNILIDSLQKLPIR